MYGFNKIKNPVNPANLVNPVVRHAAQQALVCVQRRYDLAAEEPATCEAQVVQQGEHKEQAE